MPEKLQQIKHSYSGAYNLVSVIDYVAYVVYILAAGALLMGIVLSLEAHGTASGIMFMGTFLVTLILSLMALVMQGIAAGLQAIADTAAHTLRAIVK